MKKIALALPALVAAALAVTGCAKGVDNGNATLVTNESVSDNAGDGNLTDPPVDLNASDSTLSDTPSNAP